MDRLQTTHPETRKSIINLLLGFFGVVAAFLFLPRTLKYLVRRYFFGIVSEIVAIVITGLLTEKAVDLLSENESE